VWGRRGGGGYSMELGGALMVFEIFWRMEDKEEGSQVEGVYGVRWSINGF